MKLKKEICRRCNQENTGFWAEGDERRWEYGKIYCPCLQISESDAVIIGAVIKKQDAMKHNCPYKLEQMVLK